LGEVKKVVPNTTEHDAPRERTYPHRSSGIAGTDRFPQGCWSSQAEESLASGAPEMGAIKHAFFER
jgi:hypothetical protein